MKNLLINLLLFIVIFASCQHNITNTIFTLNYTIKDENQEKEYFNCFLNNYSFSIWSTHSCYQNVNDSLIYAALSKKQDTIYVYNFKSHNTNKIVLNQIPKYSIFSIYYHNNDSIFIFYDRFYIYNKTDNVFDFILINGNGEVLNKYSLNEIPYIYKGDFYNMIVLSSRRITNRIIDGNLLLNFSIYSPGIEDPDFINFHPKQLCLYNLSNKKFKMLNVKFPVESIGKRYNRYCIPGSCMFCYDKDKNIIVYFPFSNRLYRYNFSQDTLIQIKCKYDYTFENIDSTAWVKGRNYMSTQFREPVWDAQNHYYLRSIEILSYKFYEYERILQVMDSNFNHIAYVLNTKDYNTPFYINNTLLANHKLNKLPYNIQLNDKVQQMSWKEFETNHLTKKQTGAGKTITLDEYLIKLKIPDNSLVVIINLNYPCGHCLDVLFSKMKANRADYEKANVYYVIYDNNIGNFSETLKKKYELSDSKFIKIDKVLLERVRLFDKSITDYKYRIIEYKIENKVINVFNCTFDKLIPTFDKKIIEKNKNI